MAQEPNSGWTLSTLERHLTEKINFLVKQSEEREERSKERIAALKNEIAIALNSVDKAGVKADAATEKRFEGVNEFRAALSDASARLMPRSEYTVQHESLAQVVKTLEAAVLKCVTKDSFDAHAREDDKRHSMIDNKLSEGVGRDRGFAITWGVIITVISIALAVLSRWK